MASRQKVSIEEKVRIVRDYLKGKISQQAGARSVGVDQQTLESWIGIYENYGVDGFTRKQNRVYSAEVKTGAVIDYLNGGGQRRRSAASQILHHSFRLTDGKREYGPTAARERDLTGRRRIRRPRDPRSTRMRTARHGTAALFFRTGGGLPFW